MVAPIKRNIKGKEKGKNLLNEFRIYKRFQKIISCVRKPVLKDRDRG